MLCKVLHRNECGVVSVCRQLTVAWDTLHLSCTVVIWHQLNSTCEWGSFSMVLLCRRGWCHCGVHVAGIWSVSRTYNTVFSFRKTIKPWKLRNRLQLQRETCSYSPHKINCSGVRRWEIYSAIMRKFTPPQCQIFISPTRIQFCA